ncbi:MAG: hypothetical protein RBS48_01145 [Ignavibacteriaceae bacterium]|jgi:5-hydroxyisourate hydrolase-like protein (transthyretin family)|nr:MAG: hypothetical protein APF79_09450 [bacterium BRH_c32]MDX9923339.1 hypothetical protein [Ignavibacteriaceae bacterium]
MKKLISFLFITLIIVGCSKEKKELNLSSAEAFTFTLDKGAELNASVMAKDFTNAESNGIYSIYLLYSVNLQKPTGEVIVDFKKGELNQPTPEILKDIRIDVQAELDSTYAKGTYKIIFNVIDKYSNKTAHAEKEFELD